MIKLASSCLQPEGVYKSRIDNMVGGEEKTGCSNYNHNNSSSTNSGSGVRTTVSVTSTPTIKNSNRGGGGGGGRLTKMEHDSGFSSRSPTPGNLEWKEGQIQSHHNSGDQQVKGSCVEVIQKRKGSIPSAGKDCRMTKFNSQNNGLEVKEKGTEKLVNNGVDCKSSSSSYDNSRSYYEGNNSYSNHSSGSGQYKKYYNQQYGNGYGYNHNNQRRYNSNNNNNFRNNGNRTSKNWSKGGSRSPNSASDDWKERGESNGSFKSSSSSDVTLVNGEDSLVSLVECHNKLALDAPGESKNNESNDDDTGKNHGTEDKDDSRKYRQSNNNSSGTGGQYKRQSNQQYGNGYAYIRRYSNNNYNYRNYGNNRRQFQNHNDYYHHQNHHYSNNNGYFHHEGPNRGYSMHSPPFYDNYRRGNGQDLVSPDFDESLPWPPKRGNWPNGHNANLSFSSNDKGYSSPRSRKCSPDTSPSSTADSTTSSNFLPGQNCEVSSILLNGNIISAQHLGPYDYICGNMTSQQNGSGYPYPTYPPNYYYNYPGSSTVPSRNIHPVGVCPQTVGLLVATGADANCSGSTSESTQGDKTLEWAEDYSDETDSESVATSLSTRCNSPEDGYENLPKLKNDATTRSYDESSPLSKESVSPNGTARFLPVRRMSVPQFSFPPEWFEDFNPDEVIKQFSLAGEVKDKPRNLSQGSSLDSLSEAIWKKFSVNQQTTETFKKKVELWRDAYRVVRILNFAPDFKHDPRNFPTFGLQVVGSTMSGFGSNTSDVDMCLLIRATEVDQRFEAVDKLQTLCCTLKVLPCVENQELIYAKVPILKFRDANRRLEVDLNCNNFVGIRNTHLLYSYAQMDWRLKPLVLNVKLWAKYHRINDAKNMTISSYSLVLMVIHFLQYGVDEPVLPVLQKMYPEKFNNSINILAVSIHETMPAWESRNTQSLAELLLQFFEYYGRKFDYTRNAVSVRLGGTVSVKAAATYRSSKNDPHQWKFLCIEEPFDRTNTARSVYDHDIFQKILAIFYASWQRLLVSRSLDSIFMPISDEDARAISMRVR